MTPQQYMLAVANREHKWIKEFATPHFTDSALCYLPQQSSISEHLRDLQNYMQMIPHLVPSQESLSASVLWHPDLHANNIMVVEKERTNGGMRQFNIVSILDWQNAWAGPMFLQLDVPDVFHSSDALSPLRKMALPTDLNEKSEEEQKQLQDEYKRALVHRYYQLRTFPHDLLHFRGRAEVLYLERIMREPWGYGLSPVRSVICSFLIAYD